jgi:hypothetical protein
MLQQYFGSRKTILFILAGVVILALLLIFWRLISLQRAASESAAEPALRISYCGAEPEELCVLSFGRDMEDNMVVNVFVPDRKFPDFYLKIKRPSGESVYLCEKNREVSTSVFCFGEMVNLQEKMEISLISSENDRLIAFGNIMLNAILVSGQFQSESDGIQILEETLETPTPMATVASTALTSTPTPTFTPDPSYPSYP